MFLKINYFLSKLAFIFLVFPTLVVSAQVCHNCKMPPETYCPATKEEMKSFIESGNATAEAYLGLYYTGGMCGYSKDIEKGIELIRKSASQKNNKGLVNLASMHFFDIGVKKDEKKAIEYLKLAEKGGSTRAKAKIGMELIRNAFIPEFSQKKFKEGYNLIAESASLGDLFAIRHLVQHSVPKSTKSFKDMWLTLSLNNKIKERDPFFFKNWDAAFTSEDEYHKEMTKWFFANYIDPNSSLGFGASYLHGRGGLKRDKLHALHWFRKTLDKGSFVIKEIAKELLENNFKDDEVFKNNKNYLNTSNIYSSCIFSKEELEFYGKNGSDYANTVKGIYHLRGSCGYEKNMDKAMKIFEVAAKNGEPLAYYKLSEKYFALKKSRDIKLAIKYLELAAKMNYPNAFFRLATQIYGNKKFLEYNPKLSVSYMKKASEYGVQKSAYYLSNYYENIYLDSKNPTTKKRNGLEFLKWLKLSANRCEKESVKKLGMMYEKGELVKKDKFLALFWSRSPCGK